MTAWFSYDGDDVFLPEEPVRIRLRAHVAVTEDLMPEVQATIRVTDQVTGKDLPDRPVQARRDWQDIELGVLPPSTYTIEIQGQGDTAPVSDVFVVAAPEEME